MKVDARVTIFPLLHETSMCNVFFYRFRSIFCLNLSFHVLYLVVNCLSFNREEFDEEKEPDGMLLSGWTQAPPAKDDKQSIGNGGDSSNALQTEPADAVKDGEMEEISESSGKKRKLSEGSKASILDATDGTRNHKEVEKLDDDDDDDVVMFDDLDSMTNKKKRLQ